jgi:enterochelin esterase-like enzyme
VPAAIGSAFVNSVATPTVASAPPRWKPSWSATNASPWQARTAATKTTAVPPPITAFVATSPAAGFVEIGTGPDGGSVVQGWVPNSAAPRAFRPTVVYLPPGYDPAHRYPVVYLLQGFPGSPYQFVDGLDLPSYADEQIAAGRLPPFLAVIPPAGIDVHHGDWTGIWERYLVRDVLPWADSHLPTIRSRTSRTLAGLSAGGFGALDIGLRHPELFGTLEAWSGYFRPLRSGALVHATSRVLLAHDPSLLARREAPLLRRLGTRFFLSSGTTADRVTARATKSFSAELRALRLPHRLWLAPGGHDGALWRAQLPAAIGYALAPQRGSRLAAWTSA